MPTIDYDLCIISKHILASFPQLIFFKKFELGELFKVKVKVKVIFGVAFHKLKYEPSLKSL